MPTHPEKFYLTTPIYYVNARPHIGHAYTTIVADVVARRRRLLGYDTWFLTGTDEHGQKIERSAAAAGIPPQQFADQVSASFRQLWDRMGLTYNDYIRTTDPRHKQGVQKLFRTLYDRGHIYLSSYTGQYCVGEEMFVEGPPGTLGPDGRPTETVTEENFFFRLSNYQRPLIDLVESGELDIQPEARRNEVLSFLIGRVSDLLEAAKRDPGCPDITHLTPREAMPILKERGIADQSNKGTIYAIGALKDLSISRSSFTWGIPVPDLGPGAPKPDGNHVIYVWLDALANYMTAIGYGSDSSADQARFEHYWPADLHIIGKEISRFHCVYWPAFLLALNPATALSPAAKSGAPGLASETWVSAPPKPSTEETSSWAAKMLPKAITAHGWLLFEESKMSKSRGNIVRTETILDGFGDHYRNSIPEYNAQQLKKDSAFQPVPEATKGEADLFASDVLRYFLLREIPFGQDGSFSFDAMITRYNADLANGYGNLVSRVLKLIEQNCNGAVPTHKPFQRFVMHVANRIPRGSSLNGPTNLLEVQIDGPQLAGDAAAASMFYEEAFKSMRFASPLDPDLAKGSKAGVLDSVLFLVTQTDGFLTATTPWKLAKLHTHEAELQLAEVLYTAAESIRILTALLYPILPYATARVWAQLGLGSIEEAAARGDLRNLEWGGLKPGTKLGSLAPIFPRADKGLAQIMTDMETKPSLTAVTADNDAATSEGTEFREAPMSDFAAPATTPGAPGLDSETWVDAAQTSSQAARATSLSEKAERRPGAPSMAQSHHDMGGNANSPSAPSHEPTSPSAPPRTSTLPHDNPGAQVGGSSAPGPELTKPPSHTQTPGSGLFAGTAATPQITIDDFAKVELRVARILVAERIPKADKLLRLEVDLGYETRQILSGIAEWYTPEDLIGRKIVVITNLAPRKMRGLESHGMLLAASHGENGKPVLATFAEEIEVGARLK